MYEMELDRSKKKIKFKYLWDQYKGLGLRCNSRNEIGEPTV